jgi:hypothetical protein
MSQEPADCDAGGKPDPWPEPRWLEAHESPLAALSKGTGAVPLSECGGTTIAARHVACVDS